MSQEIKRLHKKAKTFLLQSQEQILIQKDPRRLLFRKILVQIEGNQEECVIVRYYGQRQDAGRK